MSSISHPVGTRQPNLPTDVRTVQRLLNRFFMPPLPLLSADGRCGLDTQFAIAEFQRRIMHLPRPDGIVSPAGLTIRRLSGRNPGAPETTVRAFVSAHLSAARVVQATWGVPVSVVLAQSALETGWGEHVKDNAWFGIKGRSPSGRSATFGTHEVVGGKVVAVQDSFRAYSDYADAADDYGRYLATTPRYAGAFKAADAERFVRIVAHAGYATDPDYAAKLISIIRHNELSVYDAAPGKAR